MKLPTRLIAFSFVAALLVSAVSFKDASAQTTLSDEQVQRISNNCLSIKNTLEQLHASDALLRVNRGQIYEAMATKLMDRFNGRLGSNSLDTTGVSLVTSSYRMALTTFRTDYQLYERQLSAALKIDCDKQPAEFHNAIEEARTKRNKVHSDVVALHQYIDDYRSAVNDFFINYERVAGGR